MAVQSFAFASVMLWLPGSGTQQFPVPESAVCELIDGDEVCIPPFLASSSREHILLSHRIARGRAEGDATIACTAESADPYGTGSFRECCGGLEKTLGNLDGRWYFKCLASSTPPPTSGCTAEGADPWRTGDYVECCSGAQKELGQWSGSSWSYRCRRVAGPVTDCTTENGDPYRTGRLVDCCEGLSKELGQWSGSTMSYRCLPSLGGGGSQITFKALQWNVYYRNRDLPAIARTIAAHQPAADIVGLCEFTGSVSEMARELGSATGKRYEVQPGRSGWKGYGTDIFFDAGRWRALEGGVSTAQCDSINGKRAANWVVLQERSSGKILITGGIHLSFCSWGCDWLHECELWELYERFHVVKDKYQNAPVVWMGDLNRAVHHSVVKNMMNGRIGSRTTFQTNDVSQASSSTHMNGGAAIDHIFGERHQMIGMSGGLTGQGEVGRRLVGADHFPIFAILSIA